MIDKKLKIDNCLLCKYFTIPLSIKIILLFVVILLIFIMPYLSQLFFTKNTIFKSNNILKPKQIISLNTNDILNENINNVNIKLNFTFYDYKQNDNLLQTDVANNGLRLEINSAHSLFLLQYTDKKGFSALKLFNELKLGHTYELMLNINSKIIEVQTFDQQTKITNNYFIESYKTPSVKAILIGSGFDETRMFNGKINSYQVSINSISNTKVLILHYINFLLFVLLFFLFIGITKKKIYYFLLLYYDNVIKSLIYLIIISIFIFAFLMRLTIYNIPFVGPDTIGYLGVAFQYFEKGIFDQIAERSYPYPLFLTTILELVPNITIITTIQHLLGLFSGILFLRIWIKIDILFLNLKKVYLSIYNVIGVVVLFLLLCDGWIIQIEHHAHPEALTTFLIMWLLYIYLKFYEANIKKESVFNIGFFSISFLLSNFMLLIYQPRFVVSFVFLLIIALIILYKNLKIIQSLFIIFISTFLIYIILVFPFSNFDKKEKSSLNLSAALFYHNLNSIIPIIENDITNNQISQKEVFLLKIILRDYKFAKKPVNNYGTGFNKTLSYNTDYLGKTFYSVLEYYEYDYLATKYFYNYYLKKALMDNPISLISKVLKELLYFYSNELMFSHEDNKYNLWKYSYETVVGFKSHFPTINLLSDYISNLKSIQEINNQHYLSIDKDEYKMKMFIKELLPYIIMCFILLLGVSYKYSNIYLEFGLFVSVLLLIQFGLSLTVALVNTNSVVRYLDDQFSLIVLFEFSAVIFIVLTLSNFVINIRRLK